MNNSILRIIDANFNRSREALRTMEDYARFVLDNSSLSSMAKHLRHQLCKAMELFPLADLLNSRNTPGDVGTTVTTESEAVRPGAYNVLVAAAKRLSEALRVIEEYGKIDNAVFAAQIESIRYQSYELEKQLLTYADPSVRFKDVKLYVLLTESLCKLPIIDVAKQILDAGVDCIQLREKDKTDSQLLDLAYELSELCHATNALFIVNDRPDIATLAKADGIHLGQGDLPVDAARKVVSHDMIIGKSTHSIAEAQSALDVDYLAIGAIYPSGTKTDVAPVGCEMIKSIANFTDKPIVAIGGITPQNAQAVFASGASGIAICQAVIASDFPAAIVAEFKTVL
ncbi:MAG: thiamine phosphate synthase [Phycisphaerae bacterium]|nr:thiamine phosphate synthase [Phycisphaerae bacterium]